MVRRPVRALLESGQVAKVMVLAQAPDRIASALPSDPRITVRASGDTIATTILALCDDPSVQWPVLVTTADHALLDAATVDEFAAAAEGADIAVGVVQRDVLLRRFPDARRTWLKFQGGAYTGANLFALASPSVAPAVKLWRSVEQDRKSAWRIISLLGPIMLVMVALRLASLDDVMAQLSARLDLKLRAVRLGNPLAGIDVDKAEDHALVEAILAGGV
jgi:2-C-methyl-D-erythritol 4-phosphate cytidylyltransferase